mmetsp:Transcript_23364/g.88660  ORF Transcript_23364/g.88660 Transcript_23364/m.88660 type:complete len:443 (+) Transcript_23364:54-1382(+)
MAAADCHAPNSRAQVHAAPAWRWRRRNRGPFCHGSEPREAARQRSKRRGGGGARAENEPLARPGDWGGEGALCSSWSWFPGHWAQPLRTRSGSRKLTSGRAPWGGADLGQSVSWGGRASTALSTAATPWPGVLGTLARPGAPAVRCSSSHSVMLARSWTKTLRPGQGPKLRRCNVGSQPPIHTGASARRRPGSAKATPPRWGNGGGAPQGLLNDSTPTGRACTTELQKLSACSSRHALPLPARPAFSLLCSTASPSCEACACQGERGFGCSRTGCSNRSVVAVGRGALPPETLAERSLSHRRSAKSQSCGPQRRTWPLQSGGSRNWPNDSLARSPSALGDQGGTGTACVPSAIEQIGWAWKAAKKLWEQSFTHRKAGGQRAEREPLKPATRRQQGGSGKYPDSARAAADGTVGNRRPPTTAARFPAWRAAHFRRDSSRPARV